MVERNPSNACNLVVCSCAVPWLAYWCVRSALPHPTVRRSAINLVYCLSPVKRKKRFNDLRHRDGQRLRVFFTTNTLSGIAPVSRFQALRPF
ncbi:hypothetical protein QUB37_27880 [Microcoleus sp. AT3-A2]